jgi:hypothetical protein
MTTNDLAAGTTEEPTMSTETAPIYYDPTTGRCPHGHYAHACTSGCTDPAIPPAQPAAWESAEAIADAIDARPVDARPVYGEHDAAREGAHAADRRTLAAVEAIGDKLAAWQMAPPGSAAETERASEALALTAALAANLRGGT